MIGVMGDDLNFTSEGYLSASGYDIVNLKDSKWEKVKSIIVMVLIHIKG